MLLSQLLFVIPVVLLCALSIGSACPEFTSTKRAARDRCTATLFLALKSQAAGQEQPNSLLRAFGSRSSDTTRAALRTPRIADTMSGSLFSSGGSSGMKRSSGPQMSRDGAFNGDGSTNEQEHTVFQRASLAELAKRS